MRLKMYRTIKLNAILYKINDIEWYNNTLV